MSSGVSIYNEIESDVKKAPESGATVDELVLQHAPLVKRITYHLMGRLPNTLQVDDLIQAGMIGLLEAAKKFDTEKGASFETYAGIRIRGSILDEVRRHDWTPRSVHKNSRMISEKMRAMEHTLGRDARNTEIAESLGVSVEEYHQMLQDTSTSRLFVLDDIISNQNFDESEGFSAQLESPTEVLEQEDLSAALADAIKQLPDRERLVLALYYDEDLNLKEIGAVLDVSESRICQIHSQALLRLQSKAKQQGAFE